LELKKYYGELADIAERVYASERLSVTDAVRLFKSNDLITIGHLADTARNRISGNDTFFVVNRHINYTNVCVNQCRFCAFFRTMDHRDATTMSLDDVFQAAEKHIADGITELHIVGGLHPELPYNYYMDMLKGLKERFPGIHLKAFTMVEIDHIAAIGKKSIQETLMDLKEAGLGSIPGGGAEVFHPELRRQLCPSKISGKRWLEIARIAHNLDIPSNATMLYGHLESLEQRVDHLLQLRTLQDDTGGFLAFIPLAFHPENTQVKNVLASTGYDDLKTIAVSRLFLDNIPHIKAYWIMLGPKIAQIAQSFGADDMDGTVIEERITHSAGARTAQSMTRSELVHLIKESGRIPVERDTLYNRLKVG